MMALDVDAKLLHFRGSGMSVHLIHPIVVEMLKSGPKWKAHNAVPTAIAPTFCDLVCKFALPFLANYFIGS